ncbi:MAG: hypothetical protein MJA27_20140 [Pseudanabaenales cyanobacterium]|nr:hypothetical protein [Pseudanabaenales cyanobacterium]
MTVASIKTLCHKKANPKSKIQNPKSKIQNPKSKIQNPKSFCFSVWREFEIKLLDQTEALICVKLNRSIAEAARLQNRA